MWVDNLSSFHQFGFLIVDVWFVIFVYFFTVSPIGTKYIWHLIKFIYFYLLWSHNNVINYHKVNITTPRWPAQTTFRWGFNRSSGIGYFIPLFLLAFHSRRTWAQRPHPRPPHGPASRKEPMLNDKTGRKSLRHVISRPKRKEDNSTNR